MYGPPGDPVLLREHDFYESRDVNDILSPETFDGKGGFHPISKFGLGYLNYNFKTKDEIYSKDKLEIFKGHMHEKFDIWCLLFALLCIIWCIIFYHEVKFYFEYFYNRKNNKTIDDIEKSAINEDDSKSH